uniref:Alcohol dehydrogenase 1 (Fragments) n=1 Tax=Catharanthus roseus TaxID=4058 RepID=ADH1_CATRO|nr:RecName: Full=Alcohol dehydrogenase 1 [Catharanthus roseus]
SEESNLCDLLRDYDKPAQEVIAEMTDGGVDR